MSTCRWMSEDYEYVSDHSESVFGSSDSESNKSYSYEEPESSGSKRSRVDDGYERRIDKLKSEITRLKDENKQLKESAMSQLADIQSSNVQLINALSTYTGIRFQPGCNLLHSVQSVELKQLFNINGERYSIEMNTKPMRFSTSGVFPHAIAINKKTQSQELQVESRRPITLSFVLVNKLDGQRMTEKHIRDDGILPFKMSLHYADNNDLVEKNDFRKMKLLDLTEPKFEVIRTHNMVGGKVIFQFRFQITSCDATPRGRSFVVKITPDVKDLEYLPNLTCTTPAFNIRSKVTALKVNMD